MRIREGQRCKSKNKLNTLIKNRNIIHKNEFHNITSSIVENSIKEIEYSAIANDIPLNTLLGLKACKWPGRYQILKSNYAQFYLDGAHTKESMVICVEWFKQHNRFVFIFYCNTSG